jgi:uncharacterized protein with von Willebrand factor type A (vWA) domain
MFVDFFYFLRRSGLKVSVTEWLVLMRALCLGHARSDLASFYGLARALLVKREGDFDLYDRAFAAFFAGVNEHFELDAELLSWLENAPLPSLGPEDAAHLQALDFEELRRLFEERLREQSERHDGGSHWIGTGGTSPFGHGGRNPAGVRVGGSGGARSAIQVATSRRFRNLSGDRILDTRQIGLALRRLRRLERHGSPDELDLAATIDRSARNGGDIDLVFAPEKKNRVKLMLMMDVGGSMDPHAELCERLFSAAHKAQHFRRFEHRFFHNCVYERVFDDISQWRGEPTSHLLKQIDSSWSLVFVGDAWMSPYELTQVGGAIDFAHRNETSGLAWLERLRRRCPDSVWLNPEPERVWGATSIQMIRRVFPMFALTLDGLAAAVEVLRGNRPNRPVRAA